MKTRNIITLATTIAGVASIAAVYSAGRKASKENRNGFAYRDENDIRMAQARGMKQDYAFMERSYGQDLVRHPIGTV